MSDRQVIRCPHCNLRQFMTANTLCRKCTKPLLRPVSGGCINVEPNLLQHSANSMDVTAGELGDYADMQPIGASVGERLRRARRAMRVSQEEIAFRAHVTQQWVSYVERGISNSQIGTLDRYMRALGVPLHVLLATDDSFDLFLEGRRK